MFYCVGSRMGRVGACVLAGRFAARRAHFKHAGGQPVDSFLQWLCFVRETGHRVSYGARIVLFAAGLFPVLAACAYFQRWFPPENAAAWVGFTALFFLLLAVFTLCFEVAFAIQGKRYAGLLGEYHRRRDGQSAPPQN